MLCYVFIGSAIFFHFVRVRSSPRLRFRPEVRPRASGSPGCADAPPPPSVQKRMTIEQPVERPSEGRHAEAARSNTGAGEQAAAEVAKETASDAASALPAASHAARDEAGSSAPAAGLAEGAVKPRAGGGPVRPCGVCGEEDFVDALVSPMCDHFFCYTCLVRAAKSRQLQFSTLQLTGTY